MRASARASSSAPVPPRGRQTRGAKRGDLPQRDRWADAVRRHVRGDSWIPLENPPAVLHDVVVVFAQPKTASNVGAFARCCAAFECESPLRLVSPVCDVTSRAALNAAKGAQRLVRDAVIVDTLDEALIGCSHAVAFHPWDSDDEGGLLLNLFDDLDAVVEAFPGGGPPDGEKLALVFGNEADGLSKSDLERCDAVCSIPMGRLVESLSVTHAGVIALSRYYERRSASGLATEKRK